MKYIEWCKGWPVTFAGFAFLSTGSYLHGGLDAALITEGICLIVAGTVQYVVER